MIQPNAGKELKLKYWKFDYEEYMDCKDDGIYTISNFTWNHLKMIEGNGIFGDINKDAYDFVNEEISQFDMFFADEKNWPY